MMCLLVTTDHEIKFIDREPEMFIPNEYMDKALKNPSILFDIVDTIFHRNITLGILGESENEIYDEEKRVDLPEDIDTKIGGLFYEKL